MDPNAITLPVALVLAVGVLWRLHRTELRTIARRLDALCYLLARAINVPDADVLRFLAGDRSAIPEVDTEAR